MTNIITFLSEYGEKGGLLSPQELEALVNKHQLTSEESETIFANNSEEIATLLDTKANVYAILVPAEDDDDSDDSDDSEEAESIAA